MSIMSRIAHDWAVRSFGADHVSDTKTRSIRSLEEAAEFCQAAGAPKELAIKVIETVYSRPVGKAEQELGGVLLTAAIVIESLGLDYDEILERELRRVLQKTPKHFAERNQEKIDLGLVATTCTREHACGGPLAGPCNGFPRSGCAKCYGFKRPPQEGGGFVSQCSGKCATAPLRVDG